MNNRIHLCLSRALPAAAALVLVTAPALAGPPQIAPEKAIKARQSAYYLMGQQMARINATVKGDWPLDKAGLQLSAETLDVLSRIVGENFPAGTDKGTKAKPEIWKDPARFKQLGDASQVEVGKLKAAVATGDMGAIKGAYGAASKSCKDCHDTFKAQ